MSAERVKLAATAMAVALLSGCDRHIAARDVTPASQPGIVIDSTRFKVVNPLWIGPDVEGYVVVHNSAQAKLDQHVICEARPHQQQLLVWSEESFADLEPGQSMELWFWGHPTRNGLLDIVCRVRAAGDRS